MMKGDFRFALQQLVMDIIKLQYHPEHGEVAMVLLKKWDVARGDDWVHTTLKEFKEKQG